MFHTTSLEFSWPWHDCHHNMVKMHVIRDVHRRGLLEDHRCQGGGGGGEIIIVLNPRRWSFSLRHNAMVMIDNLSDTEDISQHPDDMTYWLVHIWLSCVQLSVNEGAETRHGVGALLLILITTIIITILAQKSIVTWNLYTKNLYTKNV